jgi:hypothetical protein
MDCREHSGNVTAFAFIPSYLANLLRYQIVKIVHGESRKTLIVQMSKEEYFNLIMR